MVPLPRPASPRALWRDIKAFAGNRRPHHWIALALAVIIPAAIIFSFSYHVSDRTRPRPKLIYVESWNANRTMEESKADVEKRAAQREEAMEARRKEFQALQDKLGL